MLSLLVFGVMFTMPFVATVVALLTGQWWLLWVWPIWALALLDDYITMRRPR